MSSFGTSYANLSPREKQRYDKIIKLNSGKKKEFIFITKKGEQTTKTLNQFKSLFLLLDDAPQPPQAFLEKIGSPQQPEKGEGYKKLVEKYESAIQTRKMTPEEQELIEGMNTDDQGAALEAAEKFGKHLEQLSPEKKEFLYVIKTEDPREDAVIRANNALLEKAIKDDTIPEFFEYVERELEILKREPERFKKSIKLLERTIANNKEEEKQPEASLPDPLESIVEDYKLQEIQEVQQKRLNEAKAIDGNNPVDPVTPEEANNLATDIKLIKPRPVINPNLEEIVLYDEPLTESLVEENYPDVGLTSKTTLVAMGLPIVQGIGGNAATPDVEIAAGNTVAPTEPMDEQGTPQQDQPTQDELLDQPVKQNVEARVVYKFEVRFHKAQIAEYFFNWNAPAWDQQLSDSIKQSEELYTKEYLLGTMARLIADPYFKIDSIATNMDSSMDDILTEYHEISQIQFCKQRNMQTGKREKLIGMKLKDLINITALATGTQMPIEQSPYAVDGIDPVDETGAQMQSTPTEPNLVAPESDVLFEKDKGITMWDIGKKAMETLNNENKPFKLNQELINDAQNKPGVDLFVGSDKEKTRFVNRVDMASLMRVIVDDF